MEININQIIHGDCLNVLKNIPNEYVNIIVTDPPFNIGKNYKSYKDRMKKEEYIRWCEVWLKECIRILMPTGSFYLFNYPENNAYLMPFLDKNMLFKRWMTWHYPTNTGMSPTNYTRTQHSILFYTKTKNATYDMIMAYEKRTRSHLFNHHIFCSRVFSLSCPSGQDSYPLERFGPTRWFRIQRIRDIFLAGSFSRSLSVNVLIAKNRSFEEKLRELWKRLFLDKILNDSIFSASARICFILWNRIQV